MARLSLIIVAVFMTLLLGSEGRTLKKRNGFQVQVVQTNDIFGWLCQNQGWSGGFDWCSLTTTVPPSPTTSTSTIPSTTTTVDTTTTQPTTTTEEETTTTAEESTTTIVSSTTTGNPATMSVSLPTALERAHWCQFSNGSYVPLGVTFMYTTCLICQCTQSHAIVCSSLQCQPTPCDDGSTPVYGTDQCCPHCTPPTPAPATTPVPCVYGGISFPQGSIIKQTANNVQCYCQSGSIVCQNMAPATTVTSTKVTSTYMTYLTNSTNTPIYIIIIVVCILLILGSLLCCVGAILYYYFYYYPSQQQAVQDAYDQYYTSAGWQPMGEDGQIVDASVLEKQAEAEKSQVDQQNYPTGNSQQYIPPPYAIYNGPYEKN